MMQGCVLKRETMKFLEILCKEGKCEVVIQLSATSQRCVWGTEAKIYTYSELYSLAALSPVRGQLNLTVWEDGCILQPV
jgi:hypothetical protein